MKLKEYLMQLPLLSPSITREKLQLYLVVSNTTVSSTLIREEEDMQKPIYYTSQAFQGVEANYPRPTNKKDVEQDRCSRAPCSMGQSLAYLTQNINLKQQSKPRYLLILLQNSLILKKKKSPKRRHGWSRQIGPPPRRLGEQVWFSCHLQEKS